MIQRFAFMILVTHIHGRAGFRWISITATHHWPGQYRLRAALCISSWTCLFSLAELKCIIDYLNRNKFIFLFAVLHSAIKQNTIWQDAMDVDDGQVPVDQSGPPVPQSAPSTPQKSSEIIQVTLELAIKWSTVGANIFLPMYGQTNYLNHGAPCLNGWWGTWGAG